MRQVVKRLDSRTLGQRIRVARSRAGLSAEDVAYRLGITTNTLYRWERDAHTPSVGKLRLLAAALGVPLSEFLTEEWVV